MSSGSSYKMFISYTLNEVTTSIPGSPFKIIVSPADVYAPRSICSGTGLLSPVQEHKAYFLLSLKDFYQNPIAATTAHLSLLDVRIGSSVPSSLATSVLQVGSSKNPYQYAVVYIEYMVPTLGNYDLHVSYNGSAVKGSPFSISAQESIEVSTGLQTAALAFCILTALVALSCIVLMIVYDILCYHCFII